MVKYLTRKGLCPFSNEQIFNMGWMDFSFVRVSLPKVEDPRQ